MAAKSIKSENVNLNKMLRKSMHLPRTTSGYTLYTNVTNYTASEDSEDFINKKALSDPDYLRLCNKTYNSPKNIRRLFITGSKVYIQYFTSMFKAGKQDQGTWMERSLTTDSGKNLFDMAKDIVDLAMKKNAYLTELAVNPDAVIPINYTFNSSENTKNTLFKALSNGWVTSNIEEVYWDWTAVMSPEAFTRLGGNFNTPADVARAFMSGNTQNKFIKCEELANLVVELNSAKIKDVHNRFPRLRMVAMISNLEAVMNNAAMKKGSIRDEINYSENKMTWMKLNEELISSIGGSVLYHPLNGSLEEYKTNEQQYLFDSTLKAWFETYIEKLKKARRKEQYGSEGNTSDEVDTDTDIELTACEQKLVQLEKELKPEQFTTLLQLTVNGLGMNELKSIFNNFSKPNRNRYASKIGLKL